MVLKVGKISAIVKVNGKKEARPTCFLVLYLVQRKILTPNFFEDFEQEAQLK